MGSASSLSTSSSSSSRSDETKTFRKNRERGGARAKARNAGEAKRGLRRELMEEEERGESRVSLGVMSVRVLGVGEGRTREREERAAMAGPWKSSDSEQRSSG